MRRLTVFLLLVTLAALNGCAAYGVYDDKRLVDTITDDKALSAKIKTALMDESFTGGWAVAVYSYYGHVFLVGEVPDNMQGKAMTIAQRYKPLSVTPHWFTPSKNDENNFMLATKLRTQLIGTKDLSSTRIDTEVNAGRVVLLGVVGSDNEKHLAARAAHGVEGVTSVTSYLMLPQKAGQLGTAMPEHSGAPDGAAGQSGTAPAPSGSNDGGGVTSRDLP